MLPCFYFSISTYLNYFLIKPDLHTKQFVLYLFNVSMYICTVQTILQYTMENYTQYPNCQTKSILRIINHQTNISLKYPVFLLCELGSEKLPWGRPHYWKGSGVILLRLDPRGLTPFIGTLTGLSGRLQLPDSDFPGTHYFFSMRLPE